ncbi:putative holin-like toxin [Ligilactobacillus agilis]
MSISEALQLIVSFSTLLLGVLDYLSQQHK